MNFLLFLVACAAIASIFPAKKHFRRQALLLVGTIFATGAGIALLLDHFTPLTRFLEWGDASTGLPLYMPGPASSILGAGWGYFFIAFLWGVALIVVALYKGAKDQPVVEEATENVSEVDRIRAQLDGDIEDMRSKQLGDPVEQGKTDATMTGGPYPHQNETEAPVGKYESLAREAYEVLAKKFAEKVVNRLRLDIEGALRGLAQLCEEVSTRTYARVARDHYGHHQTQVDNHEVQRLQQEYRDADNAKKRFIESLNLKPYESADWPEKRTSLKQLIVLGIGFALAEFCISWFFLKDQLGEDSAVTLAATAALLILILGFGAGAVFQFMRRNQPFTMRLSAGIVYALCFFMLFLGFGLLLNYRDVTATENVAGVFSTILDGYASLATDLTNLLVFIINIAAFLFFYWKVLHFFDRFRGYESVNDRDQAAKMRWEEMFEENSAVIRSALEHADDKARNNSRQASEWVNAIAEKREVLARVVANLTNLYPALHGAYRGDVNEYRASNRENRSITVYPAPAYFNAPAPFCKVEEHFRNIDGGDKFLQQHAKSFEKITGYRDTIVRMAAEWDRDRQALSARLSREFRERVQHAGAGMETPIPGAHQEDTREE